MAAIATETYWWEKWLKYIINNEVNSVVYLYIIIYAHYEHHTKHINALCVKMQDFSTLLQKI